MNRRRQTRRKQRRGFNLKTINHIAESVTNVANQALNTADTVSQVATITNSSSIADVKHLVETNIVDQFEAKLESKYNTFKDGLLAEMSVLGSQQQDYEQETKLMFRDMHEELQYLKTVAIPNIAKLYKPYVAITARVVPEQLNLYNLIMTELTESTEVLLQHERVLLIVSDTITKDELQYVRVRRVLDTGIIVEYYVRFSNDNFSHFKLTTT